MLNKHIIKDGKKLRYGYTTGSCAAAASKAAVIMLTCKKEIKNVTIDTPKGWILDLDINDIDIGSDYAVCSIIKDAGDDPDITDGIKIFAKAVFIDKNDIIIQAGKGIGIVTKNGLFTEKGKPAINPVPMKMIIDEVKSVKPENKGVKIEIFVPEGEETAKKTFNPKLGIKGGISILGTTGIVEPKSCDSQKETIRLEISVFKESGYDIIFFVPGNYGEKFLLDYINNNIENIVHIGNFIGDSLESVINLGIKNILLVGHIAKLIKIAGGIFNTHSRTADARKEILASNYAYYYNDIDITKKIMDANTIEEAVTFIKEKDFFKYIAEKIKIKCDEYTKGDINIEVMIFSINEGFLAKTDGFDELTPYRNP